MNRNILANLEPASVFKYFEEICSIPHGSGNTKEISDYLVNFAKEHSLKYRQDDSNNVIIWKDGTAGYENSKPVMLQGHMDMVCEKENDCDIDFEKNGLFLELNDNIISAKGTTLGGDDGIAVAYALAILESDSIPHPPLEVVITVDEEIGMLGAAAIDCSDLKSRTMLNLDSEDEGYLLVSCAGGATVTSHLPVIYTNKVSKQVLLKISNLIGGHSGVEIDKGRANSNTLLGRTLYLLSRDFNFNLINISGGLKDNAIPRESTAAIAISDKTDITRLKNTVCDINKIYRQEYALTDPDITLTLEFTDTAENISVLDDTSTTNAISLLYNLPNGIQKMSRDIKNLVKTSLNLGILTTNAYEINYSFSARSSVSSEKDELINRISCLTESYDGYVTLNGVYPAWEYRQDSPLRELMVDVFKEQYGYEPVIQALHAGVECGLFSDKLPGLDCVSFGPDMKAIHTPQECMNVDSVIRTWNYTLEILRRLK